MFRGIKPLVTKDPNKLEADARKVMDLASWSYVSGGAGEKATMDANRLAFRQWKLIPRMLAPTTTRDLSITLFGVKYDSPIFCAPIGVQTTYHPHGEVGVAEVAGEIGVPYCASTSSGFCIEDISKANDKGAGGNGQRWFQLYWPQTQAVTESLLKRAKAAGYTALIVTLDTWALAWRPADLDNTHIPFFKGEGNETGFTDPAFREMFAKQSGGKTPEEDPLGASQLWIADVFSGAAHSWEELQHVRQHWDGPIVLKGIQHPDDALKAWECGMDGVEVSNHGGRQLDGAVGSLEMLPEIVEAVKGKTCARDPNEKFRVLFDSGVRTGVDVIKAYCLGADAVLVGRPWVYGLGIAGKLGAKEVLQGILAEIDQSMGILGAPSMAHLRPDKIRRIQYGADARSNH